MYEVKKIGYLFILCFLLIELSCGENSSQEQEQEEQESEEKINAAGWMQYIPDETTVCRLSIPGTHDSGAKGEGGIVATQDMSIGEQLKSGIRCFDIRLRAKKERLEVYHGIISQGITFEKDVLPVFVAFLEKNPTEMLIVSLKDEGGDVEEYKRLLWVDLSDEMLQSFVMKDFREDLTLGECRGKILFLHRYNLGREQMIGGEFVPGSWKDNASFSCSIMGNNTCNAFCRVEDEYKFSSVSDASQKVETVMKNIEAARDGDMNTWFITFASATSSNILSGATPLNFANFVNVSLADKIEKQGKGCLGIIFLDFAGKEHGQRLVHIIINSNLL